MDQFLHLSGVKKIFPNPANNVLTLVYALDRNSDTNVELSIFEITGRKVLNKSFTGPNLSTQIDISGLKEGLYTVNIKTSKGTKLNQKLVIIR